MTTFWPHQERGLEFLVDRGRAALFDEPGLGKSMQSLLAMNDLTKGGRILVVSPGDALGVWEDEIPAWLQETPSFYAGAKADESVLEDGIVVTNYRRVVDALEHGGWDGVIWDESQMLRNRNTRTLFKAVRDLVGKARYGYQRTPMFFLSGTPIVKAAGDVWPILWLIDRARWSSYWKFVQRWAITWEDDYGWHVEGVTSATKMWAELSDVCLRRTRKEEQGHLPPILRRRIPLDMTPRQAKAHEQLEHDMMAEVDRGNHYLLAPSALARETRLRQLLVCPRLLGIDDDGAALINFREILLNSDRPVVAYTPFVEAIPYLQAGVLRTGRPTYVVKGGMGRKFREPVDLFKLAASAGEAPVLFSSVWMAKGWSVAGYAHEIYNFEWDWNDATMVQAEGRVARPGQTETGLSNYFTHRGTHDMDGLEILAGKRRLARAILDRSRRSLL